MIISISFSSLRNPSMKTPLLTKNQCYQKAQYLRKEELEDPKLNLEISLT